MQTSPDLIRTFMEKRRLKSLAAFYMLKANYGVFYKPTTKNLASIIGVCEKTMKRYLSDMISSDLIEWQPNGNLRLKKTRYNKKFLFTVKINKAHTLSDAETLLYGKMIECNCFAQAYTIRKKRKDNASITNPKSLKMAKRREKLLKTQLKADGTGKLGALPVNARIIYTFNKMCQDANISRSKGSAVRQKLKEMNQVRFVKDVRHIGQCSWSEFMQSRRRLMKEHGFVYWKEGNILVVRPSKVFLLQRRIPKQLNSILVKNNDAKTVISPTSSLQEPPSLGAHLELR